MRFTVAPNQPLEADLTPLVREFLGSGGELHLVAEAEECGRDEVRFVAGDAAETETSDGVLEYRLHASLYLTAKACASGRIALQDGASVSEAQVLLAKDFNAQGIPQVIDTATSDEQGAFRLCGLEAGTYWIHVLSDRGQAPSREIVVEAGRNRDLGTIYLDAPLSISGFVSPASPLHPRQGVRLVLYAEGDGSPFSVGANSLRRRQGTLDHYVRSAFSDADGRFEFVGLRDGEYKLMAYPPEPSCLWPGLQTQMRVAVPAATSVEVPLDMPMMHFAVDDGTEPISGARVTLLSDGRRGGCNTDGAGQVLWGAPPGLTFEALVEADGYRAEALSLTSPATGQVSQHAVSLAPQSHSKLILNVSAEGLGDVHYAGIGVFDKETGGAVRTWDKVSQDGTHVCHVAPGEYDVRVREGAWQEVSSFYQDGVFSVLIGTEDVRRDVVLRLGGRVRVQVRDQGGTLLDARCEITAADGEEVAVLYRTYAPNTGTWHESRDRPHGGMTGAPLWADVTPALGAGSYRIQATLDGYRSVERTFAVKSSEVTEVHLELEVD
ncbi:MAG: carboxypeptidase-like regulatory domain-containing protein [Planctomycetota bacterium]